MTENDLEVLREFISKEVSRRKGLGGYSTDAESILNLWEIHLKIIDQLQINLKIINQLLNEKK